MVKMKFKYKLELEDWKYAVHNTFAWLPIKVDGYIFWLQKVMTVQMYHKTKLGIDGHPGYWEIIRLATTNDIKTLDHYEDLKLSYRC